MVSFEGFRQKLRVKHKYIPIILSVFAAIGGVAVGRNFLGSVSLVTGSSMAPTFEEGTRVYTKPISGSVNRKQPSPAPLTGEYAIAARG